MTQCKVHVTHEIFLPKKLNLNIIKSLDQNTRLQEIEGIERKIT